SPPQPRDLQLQSGVVIDARTGKVLWGKRRNVVRPIASTTKIMTAMIALARTSPEELLTATNYKASLGESVVGLKPGERMTAHDLLTALLLVSANDAADTFAARTARSRAAFVAAMNAKARALGLKRTVYGNAVGLDQPRTVSTANELALTARAAMSDPRFAEIVGQSKARLDSGSKVRRVENRNELVGRYDFVTGVKTGHTMKAGYVLVGAAKRVDANVISTVLGEPSIVARNRDTMKLLRFGRAYFQPVSGPRAGVKALILKTSPGGEDVVVAAKKTLRSTATDGQTISVVAETRSELRGPLEAGARVGTAWLVRDGKRIAQTALVTTSAVAAPSVADWLMFIVGRLLLVLTLCAFVFMMVLGWRFKRSRKKSSAADGRPVKASTARP
ncbi:MAG: D-alanyl-D-alanine carboxypeptidase, partial [Thermoleophilaceae bacterium]|nr:D-alanyl-D-alanine carboxypeptidase [Thermoleophilaceae bacterium]